MPNIQFRLVVSQELAKRLRLKQDLSVLTESIEVMLAVDLNSIANSNLFQTRNLYRRIIKNATSELKCPKCVFIDWSEAFCNASERVCYGYDKNTLLADFFDYHHYTFLGRQKIIPLLQKVKESLPPAIVW
jgi:hypothetical protein